MRYCDHQFHVIQQITPELAYATIVCAWCGNVRHLHPDGKVEEVKEAGELIKYKHGSVNPPSIQK